MRYGKTGEKKKKKKDPTYAERTTFNWMLVFYTTHTHTSFQISACTFTIPPFNFSFFLRFFLFTPENFLFRKYKLFKPTGQKLNPSEINWQIISRKYSLAICRLTTSFYLFVFFLSFHLYNLFSFSYVPIIICICVNQLCVRINYVIKGIWNLFQYTKSI